MTTATVENRRCNELRVQLRRLQDTRDRLAESMFELDRVAEQLGDTHTQLRDAAADVRRAYRTVDRSIKLLRPVYRAVGGTFGLDGDA